MSCETHDIMVLQFSLRRACSLCILTVLIFVLAAVPTPSESQVDVDSFITTWRTTTPGESITIPTGDTGGTYTVDWGDGTISANVLGIRLMNMLNPKIIRSAYQAILRASF